MQKYYELEAYGEITKIRLEKESYHNGRNIAITMIEDTGETWDVLTTNFPGQFTSDKTVFIDDEKYGQFVLDNNLVGKLIKTIQSGYKTYSEYELRDDIF